MGETGALEFIKQFGILILVGVVGVGALIYGMWGTLITEKATVEIVKNQELGTRFEELGILVDVGGAVEKPGVYKLPSGSRIGDALVLAGGLAASADREWVAQTLNLASEVKDGGKIYIPEKNVRAGSTGEPRLAPTDTRININTASTGELDSLVGIGEARAKTIIANRPYGSTEELVSKAKIPQSVYNKIKDKISVY